MFAYFRHPIGWRELFKRTYHEVLDDNCLGLAAQLGFYFFLALFPALIFLFSVIALLPVKNMLDALAGELSAVAPREVIAILREQLQNIYAQGGTGRWFTLGLLGALWSSSAATVAIISTLNQAYDIEDRRPWWKARLIAICLTLGISIFIIVAFALVLSGPSAAGWLDDLLGLSGIFSTVWHILHWPLVFLLVILAVDLIYYFAPDADTEWVWITPGSLLATVLWISASLGFRFYVSNFGSYNASYGAVGGVMVLLLWLYISGLSILIGAELNSEIDHALPERAESERPGERKKLGPALKPHEARGRS